MQLIVKEVNGQRQWIPVMNDDEIYEVLCSCIAWRALGHEKFEMDKELLDKIRTITVVIVHRSKDDGSAEHLAGIQDTFIKAVLTGVNRLGIDLPERGEDT